jgi:hypothetical protein
MASELATRFRVNDPRVVHENFDGEIVAVNLDTGTYYSLSACGAEVWAMLAAGAGLDHVVADVLERYEGSAREIEAAVRDFVERLCGEQLIVPDRRDAVPPAAAPPARSAAKKPFAAPTFTAYSDMQDLLLLDPVHDVDAAGWPVHKPAAAGTGRD